MSIVNDSIKATGKVLVQLNGQTVQEIPNLVVTTGKNFIASRMTGTTSTMSHMAVGSSSTAAAVGDSTLGAELGRVALSSSSTTGAVTTYSATFPAGTGTGAVVEAGIFNASSSGTMLCRTTFAVVNKGANDTLTITWQITIS